MLVGTNPVSLTRNRGPHHLFMESVDSVIEIISNVPAVSSECVLCVFIVQIKIVNSIKFNSNLEAVVPGYLYHVF